MCRHILSANGMKVEKSGQMDELFEKISVISNCSCDEFMYFGEYFMEFRKHGDMNVYFAEQIGSTIGK